MSRQCSSIRASKCGALVQAALWSACIAAGLGLIAPAHAGPLKAVTNANAFLSFDSTNPAAFTTTSFSGLQSGETIMALDYRPSTGGLYGLGSTSRLYLINPGTGAATQVGGVFATPLNGIEFGFDFNPVTDTIRLTSDTGSNWRINPNTAAVTVDTALAYAAGDPFAGVSPGVVGSAYDNNVAGAATTTLFDIDHLTDSVARQSPENAGTLHLLGALGEVTPGNKDVGSLVGFDITTSGATSQGFAALTPAGAGGSGLYSIDLGTGAATSLGAFGPGVFVRDLAAPVGPPTAIPLPSALLAFPLGILAAAFVGRRVGHVTRACD